MGPGRDDDHAAHVLGRQRRAGLELEERRADRPGHAKRGGRGRGRRERAKRVPERPDRGLGVPVFDLVGVAARVLVERPEDFRQVGRDHVDDAVVAHVLAVGVDHDDVVAGRQRHGSFQHLPEERPLRLGAGGVECDVEQFYARSRLGVCGRGLSPEPELPSPAPDVVARRHATAAMVICLAVVNVQPLALAYPPDLACGGGSLHRYFRRSLVGDPPALGQNIARLLTKPSRRIPTHRY